MHITSQRNENIESLNELEQSEQQGLSISIRIRIDVHTNTTLTDSYQADVLGESLLMNDVRRLNDLDEEGR